MPFAVKDWKNNDETTPLTAEALEDLEERLSDYADTVAASDGLFFAFSSTTTAGSPGAGHLRLNHATPSSVTEIYIAETDDDGNDVATWLSSLDDSTSTVRGTLIVRKAGAVAIYNVSGAITDNGAWRTIPVAHVAGAGPFSNGEILSLAFARTGDQGPAGTTGTTGASGTGQSEKAHASRTSDVAIGTSTADVTGLSITFTAGTRPILLRLQLPLVTSATAGNLLTWYITDNSNTAVAEGAGACGPLLGGTAYDGTRVILARLSGLTDGASYTYKARAVGFAAATLSCSATRSASLHAIEV